MRLACCWWLQPGKPEELRFLSTYIAEGKANAYFEWHRPRDAPGNGLPSCITEYRVEVLAVRDRSVNLVLHSWGWQVPQGQRVSQWPSCIRTAVFAGQYQQGLTRCSTWQLGAGGNGAARLQLAWAWGTQVQASWLQLQSSAGVCIQAW